MAVRNSTPHTGDVLVPAPKPVLLQTKHESLGAAIAGQGVTSFAGSERGASELIEKLRDDLAWERAEAKVYPEEAGHLRRRLAEAHREIGRLQHRLRRRRRGGR